MPKRILLLSQWFEPEPIFKGLLFARELVRRGFEVEVVTGFPNYPTGKLYPGYRMSWARREVIDGVRITRLPLFPSHDSSAVRRIATYVSFALSALLYCTFQARRPAVVYVYQLPTLGVVAALTKMLRRCAFVFDVQDVWPDALRATGMVRSGRALALVDRTLRWVYRRADTIVVLSPGFRRLLLDRGARDVELIYNWSPEEALAAPRAVDVPGFPGDDRFRLVFAGNLGKAQALDTVLETAARLVQRCPRVQIVFIGDGVERDRLKAVAVDRGLANVTFLPRVGMDEIGSVLQRADALLLHLKNDPLFAMTIPGKTQAYMAIGKPILAAVPGDASDLVREAQCGIEATPEDPESIADAAARLASMRPADLEAMGRRGSAFYAANLSVAVGVDRFARIFNAV
jgi:glycosyltransferase involved in cell wall biosynthesis